MRRNFDYPLLLSTLGVIILGLIILYSASHRDGSDIWIRQIIWFGIGAFWMWILIIFDYQILGGWARFIYGLSIILLLGVLWFGSVVRGAKSWYVFGPISFQPSEFAKLATLIMLASYLHDKRERVNDPSSILFCLGLVGLPILLILRQPDAGTALTFFPILLVMLYMAGVRVHYIVCLLMVGLLSFFIPLIRTWITFKIEGPTHPLLSILRIGEDLGYTIGFLMILAALTAIGYYILKRIRIGISPMHLWGGYVTLFCGLVSSLFVEGFLAEYQRRRLLVFLSPGIDPLGSGYHIIQSKIAIGSGGFFGKGLLRGTQSQLGFLPESQTDFILSVIGEELGFFGITILLLLYTIIISKGIHIADTSRDMFGGLLATGITSLIAFQVIFNIGMSIGMMPVVGLPLPLVSYGGSSLIMTMISLGILLNIRLRRFLI